MLLEKDECVTRYADMVWRRVAWESWNSTGDTGLVTEVHRTKSTLGLKIE